MCIYNDCARNDLLTEDAWIEISLPGEFAISTILALLPVLSGLGPYVIYACQVIKCKCNQYCQKFGCYIVNSCNFRKSKQRGKVNQHASK